MPYSAAYYAANQNAIAAKAAAVRKANIVSYLERERQYATVNRELRNAKGCARVECVCGATYTYANVAAHRKTQKHLSHSTPRVPAASLSAAVPAV